MNYIIQLIDKIINTKLQITNGSTPPSQTWFRSPSSNILSEIEG
jgi:hypothetical protein